MTAEKWFIGAIALIRRPGSAGSDQWLALWNEGRGCYQFVEAHILAEESFRDSLQREIAWTTGLKSGRDYLVSGGPRAHLEFVDESNDANSRAGYIVEFYLVELMGAHHKTILNDNRDMAWLDGNNIRTGLAEDGRPICSQLLALLKKGDLIPTGGED